MLTVWMECTRTETQKIMLNHYHCREF